MVNNGARVRLAAQALCGMLRMDQEGDKAIDAIADNLRVQI
jgi:hypothetical protein